MMQNFREKYAYKISLYLLVFYSIWMSIALIGMISIDIVPKLSQLVINNVIFHSFSFLHSTIVIAPILLIFSLVIRLFSLDFSKKWIDIGLFLIVTIITGYLFMISNFSFFIVNFSFVLPFIPLFFTFKSLFALKRREI